MPERNFRWLLKTRVFGLFIGATFAVVFCLLAFFSSVFGFAEAKLLDTYFSLKRAETKEAVQKGAWQSDQNPDVSPDILIVGIDLKALQRFGGWPFPRSVHADLVNSFARVKNQDDREKALLLDIFFIDESGSPADDFALVNAISESGRVFLETILDTSTNGQTIDEEMFARQAPLFDRHGAITKIEGDWKGIVPFRGMQTNLAAFNSAAAGYGSANVIPDEDDKIVRRQPLVQKYALLIDELPLEALQPGMTVDTASFQRLSWQDSNGVDHHIELPLTERSLAELASKMKKSAPPILYDRDGDGTPEAETYAVQVYQDYFMPSIALALAARYYGAEIADIRVRVGRDISIPRASGGDVSIPIDDQCTMLINFAGHPSSLAADGYQTFPVRSYAGYARKTDSDPASWPETRAVGGKVVMVGAFEKGMASDEKQTPYGLMFGIEIHANVLNTILTERFIREPPAWVGILITAFSILLVSFLAARMRNLWSLPLSLLYAGAFFVVASLLFDTRNLLINFSAPLSGMLLSYVTIVLYRASTEEREKRKIRSMFGKYVSPEVVAQMIDHPPELGGIDRELTVFFSDIRGFTSLSETLTPQELVRHLNVYLSAMTDIILETGGTLDKYVGDEIMCFWGAPIEVADHAYRACRCALLQRARLAELNESWPAERRLAIGIGINTGVMTVGNMGSEGRMNYTLMGDNVNLGARLEGTNKVYGTMIIVSEYTYAAVKDRFVFRELDTIRVKGKNRPVVIYELVDEL
jgi:adenylate cyclase